MAKRKKFKQNDNNLAIAYYRYSSHSQNEASIEQQHELAHERADAHGLKIVREYEDAAISGTMEDRPGNTHRGADVVSGGVLQSAGYILLHTFKIQYLGIIFETSINLKVPELKQ